MKYLFSFLVVSITCSHLPAWGWGEVGHETVGEIAERHLTPRAKHFVFEILGSEPLSAAAIFPDQVRSDDRFKDFSDYHFVTLPNGARYDSLPDSVKPKKDMNTILGKGALKLIAPDTTRDQKIILLKYLVHIVGDAHQPLHVSRPGSLGGNLCDVKWKNPENQLIETVSIHHFWDELMINFVEAEFHKKDPPGKHRWFGYRELADEAALYASTGSLKNFEPETEFNDEVFSNWYSDDLKLETTLYPQIQGRSGAGLAYCKKQESNGRIVKGDYDSQKIPTIDDAYVKKTLPILKEQLWKGGLRLAAMLDALAAAKGTKKMDPKKEKALLESVKVENETSEHVNE